MALFVPSEAPATKLGVLRQLSKTAGTHVSPIQLGGMSIGEETPWAAGMGHMDKDLSYKLLDAYWESGGNFIDTAGNYQDNTSERVIGQWAEERGIRDQLVIATKYSTNSYVPPHSVSRAAWTGNSRKTLQNSVKQSLKALRTDYIDLLYVHFVDYDTSVEEIMDSLNALVQRGVVLYLGICNAPAWWVAKCNEYARHTGKTPFSVFQSYYNVMERTAERDIIPFVRHEGMAFVPYGVLCGGRLRSDAEEEAREKSGEDGRKMAWNPSWKRTPEERAMCTALDTVREQVGAKQLTSVAIAYVMHKVPFCFPILGGRKAEQWTSNIEALSISLTPEQIKFLDDVKPVSLGWPLEFIGDGTSYPQALVWYSKLEKIPSAQPIAHKAD